MSAQIHENSEQPDAQRRQKHLDRTLEFWQPRSSRPLSQEDAREIAENLLGFFKLLQEWTRAEQEQPNRDTCRTCDEVQ